MPDTVPDTVANTVPGSAPVSGRTVDRTVLVADTASARTARVRVRDLLTAADVPDAVLEAAVLVTSELVTNAVRHGSGEVALTVGTEPDQVCIGVHDDDPAHPSVVAPYEGGGRGMFVIESIATRWEVVPDAVGKTVWARFDLDRG